MGPIYFESTQLVLVADKSSPEFVGKIGKSVGIDIFSSDSDVFWLVFVPPTPADANGRKLCANLFVH